MHSLLKKSNYFGTMLVKMGKADCLLGGATYSTADTIRPALQLVKTKKGAHLVSSCFILDRDCGEEGLKRIAMGDCAVNIDYTDTVDKVPARSRSLPLPSWQRLLWRLPAPQSCSASTRRWLC